MKNWFKKTRAAATPDLVHHPDYHAEGLRLYECGNYEQARRLLADGLKDSTCSERWNDWAAAELACQRYAEAERGFRKALELEPEYAQASANLGGLLVKQGRKAEALLHLEKSLKGIDQQQQPVVERLIALCKKAQPPAANPPGALQNLLPQIAGALTQQHATLNSIVMHLATLGDAVVHLSRPAIQIDKTDNPEGLFPQVNQTAVLRSAKSFTIYPPLAETLGIVDLGLLLALMQSSPVGKIFEFGTREGLVTLNLAANAPAGTMVFTLDQPTGARVCGERFRGTALERRIHQLAGEISTFDFSSYRKSIDMVVIHTPQAIGDLTPISVKALEMLGSGQGMILWINDPAGPIGIHDALNELRIKDSRFAGLHWVSNSRIAFVKVETAPSADCSAALSRTRRSKASNYAIPHSVPEPSFAGAFMQMVAPGESNETFID